MNRIRVILQARTTSTRLPAKALLPLAGMPSAILAARRAGRDGLDLVFATSTEPSDDALAAAATAAGLTLFRGSKDDVLGRYAGASADMDEDDVVLRITGDDPVPDGDFLRALAEARSRRGLDMLFSLSPMDGLPHGVAGQAFTVAALRRADREASLDFQREHVGPWLVRHMKSGIYDDHGLSDFGHLRCTLDTIDDYGDLQRLFAGIADPVAVPWRDLVAKLAAASPWRAMPFRFLRGQPGADPGVERLGALVPEIGTGIDAASHLQSIRQAIRCGATHIIASPGDAVRVLGLALASGWSGRAAPILRLPAPPAGLTGARLADWLAIALLGACRDLGLPRLHTVLVPEPAGARGAALIEQLQSHQASGLIRHIGVSVAGLAAARRWLKRTEITALELASGPEEETAHGLASALAARPEMMLLARPDCVDAAGLRAVLGHGWVGAAVVPLSASETWARLVDGARTVRPATRPGRV